MMQYIQQEFHRGHIYLAFSIPFLLIALKGLSYLRVIAKNSNNNNKQ